MRRGHSFARSLCWITTANVLLTSQAHADIRLCQQLRSLGTVTDSKQQPYRGPPVWQQLPRGSAAGHRLSCRLPIWQHQTQSAVSDKCTRYAMSITVYPMPKSCLQPWKKRTSGRSAMAGRADIRFSTACQGAPVSGCIQCY